MSLESQEDAQAALLALYELNLHFLRTRPAGTWPPLLTSHVMYKRETGAIEKWLPIPELYALGHGDCEDLAAAYAAECTVAGRVAVPRIDRVREGLYHITVHHADGTRTDPSITLGMGASSNPQTRGRQLASITKRVTQRAADATLNTAVDVNPTARILRNVARKVLG